VIAHKGSLFETRSTLGRLVADLTSTERDIFRDDPASQAVSWTPGWQSAASRSVQERLLVALQTIGWLRFDTHAQDTPFFLELLAGGSEDIFVHAKHFI